MSLMTFKRTQKTEEPFVTTQVMANIADTLGIQMRTESQSHKCSWKFQTKSMAYSYSSYFILNSDIRLYEGTLLTLRFGALQYVTTETSSFVRKIFRWVPWRWRPSVKLRHEVVRALHIDGVASVSLASDFPAIYKSQIRNQYPGPHKVCYAFQT